MDGSLGWSNGTCHCKIDKYIDEEFGNIKYKITLGGGIEVIGFKSHEEALKFVYKMAWVLH